MKIPMHDSELSVLIKPRSEQATSKMNTNSSVSRLIDLITKGFSYRILIVFANTEITKSVVENPHPLSQLSVDIIDVCDFATALKFAADWNSSAIRWSGYKGTTTGSNSVLCNGYVTEFIDYPIAWKCSLLSKIPLYEGFGVLWKESEKLWSGTVILCRDPVKPKFTKEPKDFYDLDV